MCVVPSGITTSSSVKSPTTTTRGVVNAPTKSAPTLPSPVNGGGENECPPPQAGEGEIPSLGGQFAVRERQVDPARLVDEVGGGVPDGPDNGHADHELQRELAGHGKGGVDDGVEEDLVEDPAQHENTANAGQGHRRNAEQAATARRFP